MRSGAVDLDGGAPSDIGLEDGEIAECAIGLRTAFAIDPRGVTRRVAYRNVRMPIDLL